MNNYTITHIHTDRSSGTTNIDSVTKPEQYISKIASLGMKSIAFTEHGNIFSWLKKKELCEKYDIKYIHAVECYITETLDEKIRDNYHCCLYSRNLEGVKELNKLISSSYNRKDNHFYYVPRISFEELIKTSENIIVTTACLGGIFGKGNDEIKKRFLDFIIKNKNRCFLEIQHHLDEKQIKLNKELYKLSKEYSLNLIIGTDTHALDETHAKGRTILQKAKNIHFSDEDKWDITLKTYDELIELYLKQKAIPIENVKKALHNTNILSDMIETFEVDKSYKYPKLYKNPKDVLKEKIIEGIKKRGIHKYPNYESEYLPRIREELETFEHNKAIDFLLLDNDIKEWARNNNIYHGYSRGSVAGSEICYIIGMTDIDSIKHDLNFQRFMNKERVSLADVDTDWDSVGREKVKQYIYSKDELYCADIITFNTVALKGSIRDVGRALDIPLSEIDDICKNIEVKENYYRNIYKELFEYVDIINGTIVSIGIHPCGLVISPIPLDENMGTLTLSTCEYPVTMLNMKEIDSKNYVKLDLLALDTVEIVNRTCELANIPRLTPDNIINDIKVWESIRENTLGIFQWESDSAQVYLKQLFSKNTIERIKRINPNFSYIDIFSVGNGAIRPAGASYRNELANGQFRDNGHEALNEFLAPTLGFLVYQEQILEFLNKFCGYSMGEADIVRRGFAKKVGTEEFIPKIKLGFINTMNKRYNISKYESEKLIENFLNVIIDASDYLFSLNHSKPYSYLGYACGYLRYYYPLEFISVLLNINNGNIEKTSKITEYALKRGINIFNPKFRFSKSEYFFNRDTNSIYKGIESIKFLNSDIGEYLYSLRNNKYDSFLELLIDLQGHINSKQLSILIKLDFFEEFGKSNKLLEIYDIYNSIYNKKQFKKDNLPCSINTMRRYSNKETEKIFKEVDTKKLCSYLESQIENTEIPVNEKIQTYFEFVGSCNIKDSNSNPRHCLVIDIDTKYSPKITLYNLKSGNTKIFKVSKAIFEDNKISIYDLVYLKSTKEKSKRKKIDGKWIKSNTETEWWVQEYWKVEN
ncbi:PHP domain-containing protein [Clostridioides sp. ZZV14-6153]|uniref:PHP domain-containing protein n=1 Tax=Clostridioides sp. ZZV14-6153 TaxID=2811494 RepID=UPI001D110F4C|nr:DNA polymerase III subunit alpha [Clostridioides sp. ZZV14-6153]